MCVCVCVCIDVGIYLESFSSSFFRFWVKALPTNKFSCAHFETASPINVRSFLSFHFFPLILFFIRSFDRVFGFQFKYKIRDIFELSYCKRFSMFCEYEYLLGNFLFIFPFVYPVVTLFLLFSIASNIKLRPTWVLISLFSYNTNISQSCL